MLILLRLSQKVGVAGTTIIAFFWLAAAAFAIEVVQRELAQSPRLASVAAFSLVVIATSGGLVGFWLVADYGRYWLLGYRVSWLGGNRWVYEERRATPAVPYEREVRGRGYPQPCTIRVLNAAAWTTKTPTWAQSRRGEIVERIVVAHGGGNIEVQELITFADAPPEREPE